jgi:lipooligosaccharide transport system permease protein
MRLPDWAWGVSCVWLRYYDVFTKSVAFYVVTTLVQPLLFLLAFGVGVGALVGTLAAGGVQVTYRAFVFSGVIGQAALFSAFFEASYGAFVRMYYQRVFQAIAVTPITLSEVLWGELLWDATKAAVAAEGVALIGVATGDFSPWCLLALLPVCFLASLLFAGMGLVSAAYARDIDQLSYPQYLLVMPMFLFCGVFYPVEGLPEPLQFVAWIFPLTAVNSLVRTLTLDLPFQWWAIPILLAWLATLALLSRRAMFRRLIK